MRCLPGAPWGKQRKGGIREGARLLSVVIALYVRNGLFFQSPDSMTSSFAVCLL